MDRGELERRRKVAQRLQWGRDVSSVPCSDGAHFPCLGHGPIFGFKVACLLNKTIFAIGVVRYR